MAESAFNVLQNGRFRYLDEGPASAEPPIVLLHGMLGDLNNWTDVVRHFSANGHRILVPVLPVYDLPLTETSVTGLVEYFRDFLTALRIHRFVLVGNSLGGHVALLYVLQHPEEVLALVLSGASGIYEVSMGSSMPRRHDRAFIRDRAAVTFYDPAHATDELVDEMCEIVNDRSRVVRLIKMARATKNETVTDRLSEIQIPTLLVWGRDDVITPPEVGEEFAARMPNSRLKFIEKCGHAPMMEHPEVFNRLMNDFLQEIVGRQNAPLSKAV